MDYTESYFEWTGLDAMLNITKVDLEVFSDAGMYLFMEKSMGGRVYYIFKTYTVKSRINI